MSTAQDIIKRHDQLESERGTWEAHWTEIADRVLPRYAHSMQRPTVNIQRGEKRTDKMIDSTAAVALERFAAVMESMLTPRNQQWHQLRATDPALNKDRETKLWFEQVTDLLFRYRYAPRANYASQQHEVYIGLGAFGTGIMHVDFQDVGGLRYRSIDLREILFDMSYSGIVDTAYRKFTQTARQMQQQVDAKRWDNLPDSIAKAARESPDKMFDVIHCVRPRIEINKERLDSKSKPIASFYISVEEQRVLSEGGFDTFPYQVSRYITGPGEIYGRSPAMLALPAIKVLNEQKRTMLTQGHRAVSPVLLTHDDGVLDTLSMKPGAVNPGGVTADGKLLVHALPVGNLAAGQELMDMERAVINDVFLVTLFQILVETPQMTATEVLERVREKGALLSPTMGRQQSESQGPMIEREIDLLIKQNLLPPLPPALEEAGGDFEIEYTSPLSRAQRAEKAAGFLRTFEFATAVVNSTQDLSIMDKLDFDTAIVEIAEIGAVPPSWMSSDTAVAEKRAARAEAQATQQVVEAAPAAAGIIKALGPE